MLLILGTSLTAKADDLLSLYQLAVISSPELRGSQYALDIANAKEDQTFGKLLPKADLSGSYSYNRLHYQGKKAESYPGTRANLMIRQPLFDLQAYLLMKSQQLLTKEGEEDLQAAHQKLILDLIERYVDALEAADKSIIVEAELTSTEKQLTRVKAMHARQMAMVTDLYELQARVETLRTNLIDSNNDAKIALEKLRELTGDEAHNLHPVRLEVAYPPPEGTMENWTEQAGRINPELSGLKLAMESARKSIAAYQAGHLPRIEMQATGNYSDTVYNNLQASPYDVATIGVEAVIPLYEGGITQARVREAEARHGLSRSKMEQKKRELEKITRASFLDMSSSPARTQATDRELAASEKARDSMEKGYELGVVNIVDLLNAQKQLSEARKRQYESRYRYFKARSSLMYQAGVLQVDELIKMNAWLEVKQ
jgi:outer membrane protein